ncbi:MAG: Cys-tRNA(Pro) deacylase [Nocardioidaceae bacterium]|nr:Cys-tRNA(Pro) deacylase [Nocardioidaceae bacterium]
MARRRDASAGTPATVLLEKAGVTFAVRAYEHDPRAASFGLEAADALGVDPSRVLKTLVVEADGGLAVAVVPVDTHLDLKAVARALGAKKAQMADPAAAERSSGYVVGGISPLGQRRPLPTVVDASASAWDTVLVSGGRRGLDLELSPHDLVTLTSATLADVARR